MNQLLELRLERARLQVLIDNAKHSGVISEELNEAILGAEQLILSLDEQIAEQEEGVEVHTFVSKTKPPLY